MKIPLLIIAGMLVVLAAVIYFSIMKGSDKISDSVTNSVFSESPSSSPSTSPEVSGPAQTTAVESLKITDEKVGNGDPVRSGDTVTVHYRGKLTNGTEFDSSYKRSEPFTFVVGQNSVIQGWEQGILGMRVGGKRTLVIPPKLGYGSVDMGVIPPNSTLIFDIELIEKK